MLCVCVGDVMDVVFFVCIVMRGACFTEVISSVRHIQFLCWYRFLMESVASSRNVV